MPDSVASAPRPGGPPPGPRAAAVRWHLLLQLLLWALLAGFYYGIYLQVNNALASTPWALVALRMGYAIALFNSLVYLIIPRWLLRGHRGRALAGGIVLFLSYRLYEYAAARLMLAYWPLGPKVAAYFQRLFVATLGHYYFTWEGVFATSISFLANMLLPIVISFLVFTLVVERRRLALERSHLRLELSYLKAQINPQFLFNTLGSLHAFTRARDPRAGDVVLHLADLMRYTLYETDAERVPLARELEFLADYLALERLRRPGTVAVAHEVRGEATTQQLAPLLLHPFLERLFAGFGAGGAGRIRSTVHVGPHAVALALERTAAGPPPPPYGTDAGVVAALRRLALQYPGRHAVHLTETAAQVRLDLRIEL